MIHLALFLAWPTLVSAQAPARAWLDRFDLAPARGVTIEIGGGDAPLCTDCVQLDVVPEAGFTNVRADARRLPLADGAVDLVVIKNFPWNAEFHAYLREDIARAQLRLTADVLRELARVLAPTGRALLTFAYVDDARGELADPRVNFAAHLPMLADLGLAAAPLRAVQIDEEFARPPTYSAWPDRVLRSGQRAPLDAYLATLAARDGVEPRHVRTFLQGFVVARCASRLE